MKVLALFIVVLLGFLLGFVCDGLITRIPKDVQTCSHMLVLEREIKNYRQRLGKLPASLDGLPLDGREHCRRNAWGEEISYVVTNGTEVILRTFGQGGSDAKIVQTFERRF